MTEHIKWNGTTLWQADLSTPNQRLRAEQDLNGRVHVIEELGDRSSNLYRDTKAANREYSIVVGLVAALGYTVQDLKAEWEAWHSKSLGLCVLERETASGAIQYLDAVAETPEWGSESWNTIEVTQKYTAPTPFWYQADDHVAGAFDGATPVTVPFTNGGDAPAWVELLIEGAVVDLKIEYGGEDGEAWEIEFAMTLAAGDELAVVAKTPASVWYTPSGSAAERAYGYRTAATSFRKAKLPPGTHSLVLSATSGTAAITVTWQPVYEALQ